MGRQNFWCIINLFVETAPCSIDFIDSTSISISLKIETTWSALTMNLKSQLDDPPSSVFLLVLFILFNSLLYWAETNIWMIQRKTHWHNYWIFWMPRSISRLHFFWSSFLSEQIALRQLDCIITWYQIININLTWIWLAINISLSCALRWRKITLKAFVKSLMANETENRLILRMFCLFIAVRIKYT